MSIEVPSRRKCARILDVAGFLPEQILSNEALAELYPEWPADKILAKTGISVRHVAGVDQTASDLAFEAARRLFAQGKISAHEIDFIILCTQAPDYALPTSACILQHRLGISRSAGALDINLGCSGFVYGLSLAKGLIETGSASRVLLLTADTYSKFIHPMDKSVRTLFGDAAAATIITADDDDEDGGQEHIGPFVFGTDGAGAKNLIVEAGGFRSPSDAASAVEHTDSSGNVRSAQNLYMNGGEVFAFTLKEVPLAVDALLTKAGTAREDIDYFVLHQANRFMLDALRKKLDLPVEKLPVCMENCGNTVSSTIPLALIQMREDGKLRTRKKLMLVGFGVGYSWAATFINF
jgi:3-oxoacyl-[acyl-carrier-protein] synthase-3